MKTFKSAFMVGAALLSTGACAAGPMAAAATTYYCGQVSSFSPDGKIPYDKTSLALKREILDDRAHIVETATQPAPSPAMRPRETVTDLYRRKVTPVYRVTERGGAFAGTITFSDFGLDRWTYDLKLKAGGTMKGSGRLLPDGIQTERHLSRGVRPMLIKEDLNMVSERHYEMCLGDMRPPKGAE